MSAKIVVLLCVLAVKIYGDVIVQTENGPYRGQNRENYVAFEGIRYAEPPLGHLRFEAPKPYKLVHSQVVNATTPGNKCMQMSKEFEISGDEDCLFMNIYTPDVKGKFPVIFFIHGGGFMFGDGHGYGPRQLLTKPLVYVNINYRLGPLGFMSGSSIAGNMGLKDQVEALKYVKNNIASFGGDPERVIITGWSAGGASVQLHYLSPMSRGLFAGGISHGGSALNPWVMQTNPARKFRTVLEHTNCTDVQCLKEVPAEKVVESVQVLQPYLSNPFNPFGIVVEVGSNVPFLTDEPIELLRRGEFTKEPWITSGVREEGYYPCAEYIRDNTTLPEIEKNFDMLLPLLLHFPDGSSPEVPPHVRQHYLGEVPISQASFKEFVKITTDYLYLTGIQTSVELQGPQMPVYTYAFDFKTTYAYGELMAHQPFVNAVAHGEDIVLIYEASFRESRPYTADERVVMNLLLDMYESFAYTRQPMLGDLPMIRGSGRDFIHIKGPNDVRTVRNYNFNLTSERPFWDTLATLISPSTAIHPSPLLSIILISIIVPLTLTNSLCNCLGGKWK